MRGPRAHENIAVLPSHRVSYRSLHPRGSYDMERCKACGEAVPVSSGRRTINAGVQRSVLVSISEKFSFPTLWIRLSIWHERLRSELMKVEKQLKRTLQFVLTNDAGVSRAAKRPLRGEILPKQKRARIEVNEGDVVQSSA